MEVAYFDTGVIAKWYVAEPTTAAALVLRRRFDAPSVLTELHRVELAAAWHAKVYRRELAEEQAERALADVDDDVRNGLWLPASQPLSAAFQRAEALARAWGSRIGARTLDTLHVAAALTLGMEAFVTGDRRQAELARVTGLRVALLT